MIYTVRYKGTRAQVVAAVQRAVKAAMGDQAMLKEVGQAVQEVVYEAFLIKTVGGTDAAGLRWEPLADMTVKKKKSDVILVEHNELEESLKPGASRPIYQIFRVLRDGVVVGTDRPFAFLQHLGGKRLPQRRLWAKLRNWPREWWWLVKKPAKLGVVKAILHELGKSP